MVKETTMKLTQLGSNQTVLTFGENEVLFSYETPVAGYNERIGWFRTEEKFSNTTTKHINRYLKHLRPSVIEVPQQYIENMVE